MYFFKLYLLVQFILFLALVTLALAVARAFFDTTAYKSVYLSPEMLFDKLLLNTKPKNDVREVVFEINKPMILLNKVTKTSICF